MASPVGVSAPSWAFVLGTHPPRISSNYILMRGWGLWFSTGEGDSPASAQEGLAKVRPMISWPVFTSFPSFLCPSWVSQGQWDPQSGSSANLLLQNANMTRLTPPSPETGGRLTGRTYHYLGLRLSGPTLVARMKPELESSGNPISNWGMVNDWRLTNMKLLNIERQVAGVQSK